MTDKIDLNTRPKLAKKARMHYDEKRSQELLLLPERVVKLNPSAAAILKRCDGGVILKSCGLTD